MYKSILQFCKEGTLNLEKSSADFFDNPKDIAGFVEKVKLPRVVAPQISYLFHPIVLKHPAYQNEKIFDLYTYFRDFDRTFMVEFTAAESTEML